MSLSDFHPNHVGVELRGDVVIAAMTVSRITDEDDVESLGRELFALVDRYRQRKVVVTLKNVEFVTSAVLGKLISLHRRLHRVSGALVLCDVEQSVARAIGSGRLETYFHIEPDLPAALAALA